MGTYRKPDASCIASSGKSGADTEPFVGHDADKAIETTNRPAGEAKRSNKLAIDTRIRQLWGASDRDGQAGLGEIRSKTAVQLM